MKFCLLTFTGLMLLSISLSFGNNKIDDKKVSNNLCSEFLTPVIKPQISKDFSVVKPNKNVEYKLIIVNPCQSAENDLSNLINSGITQNNYLINPLSGYKEFSADFFKIQNENLLKIKP